jgi:hypothetical protein
MSQTIQVLHEFLELNIVKIRGFISSKIVHHPSSSFFCTSERLIHWLKSFFYLIINIAKKLFQVAFKLKNFYTFSLLTKTLVKNLLEWSIFLKTFSNLALLSTTADNIKLFMCNRFFYISRAFILLLYF